MEAPLCSHLEWNGCQDGIRRLPRPTAYGECGSPDMRERNLVSISTPHVVRQGFTETATSAKSIVGFSDSVRVYFFDQDQDEPKARSWNMSVGKAKVFDGRSAVERRRISLVDIEGYVSAMSRPSWLGDCVDSDGEEEMEMHSDSHMFPYTSSFISMKISNKNHRSSMLVSSARRNRCYADDWGSSSVDDLKARRGPPQCDGISHDSEDEYNMWLMENLPCDSDLMTGDDGETESISSVLTCDASP